MKKRIQKHFRFDEITVSELNKKSKELNLNESEYIRQLIMSNSKAGDFVMLKKDIKRLLRELSYIGNNINQIAHIANMMMLSKSDIELIDKYRKEIYDLRILIQKMHNDLKEGDQSGNNETGAYKG